MNQLPLTYTILERQREREREGRRDGDRTETKSREIDWFVGFGKKPRTMSKCQFHFQKYHFSLLGPDIELSIELDTQYRIK